MRPAEIDPTMLGFLVHHYVEETGSWRVGRCGPGANVGRQQIVQAGDRTTPGYRAAGLEPLGVLIEHRVDDVDERLVAGEDPVAAAEQVTLEHALADVLREHLDDRPIRSSRRRPRRSDCQSRATTSRMSWSRLLASSSERRGGSSTGSPRVTSRSHTPRTRVASCSVSPGAAPRPRSRSSPADAGPSRFTAVRDRIRAHAPIARRRRARAVLDRAARARRTARPAVRTQPLPRAPRGARRRSHAARERHLVGGTPSTCWPSTTGGQVHPSACATRSSATPAATVAVATRGRRRMPHRVRGSCPAAAIAW